MREEWGPWVAHDGGEYCPFLVGQTVQTYGGRDCRYETDEWTVQERDTRLSGYRYLIRYRIRKPKGLTILLKLIEHLPEQVDA